jgi:hypothetical protein
MAHSSPDRPPRKKPSILARILWQLLAVTVAVAGAGLVQYHVQPLTSVNTVGGALLVAVSFIPGMLVGGAAVWFQKRARIEEPDVPAASAICSLLWFVYLFRAATLLIGLPVLSNWAQKPVEILVKILEFMDPDKLAHWFAGLT